MDPGRSLRQGFSPGQWEEVRPSASTYTHILKISMEVVRAEAEGHMVGVSAPA